METNISYDELQLIYTRFLNSLKNSINNSALGLIKSLFLGRNAASNLSLQFAKEIESYSSEISPSECDFDLIFDFIIRTAINYKNTLSFSLILTAVWQYFIKWIAFLTDEKRNYLYQLIVNSYSNEEITPVMYSFLDALKPN